MEKFKKLNFWTSSTLRINRIEFVFKYLICIMFLYTIAQLTKNSPEGIGTQFSILGGIKIIFLLFFVILALVTIKQRMNDINFTKWYHFLLIFFPYVLLYFLLIKKSVNPEIE